MASPFALASEEEEEETINLAQNEEISLGRAGKANDGKMREGKKSRKKKNVEVFIQKNMCLVGLQSVSS